MKIKTLTAPIALAAVLGFGPAAFAQNMVGTQQVTEADMAAVAEHCRTQAMGSDDQAAGATAAGGDAGNSGNADNDSVSSTGGPDADAGTMDGAQPTTGAPVLAASGAAAGEWSRCVCVHMMASTFAPSIAASSAARCSASAGPGSITATPSRPPTR